jgi:hypothetical protein
MKNIELTEQNSNSNSSSFSDSDETLSSKTAAYQGIYEKFYLN